MKIGIVLSSTPSYSETFFISKIKGLQKHGFEVVLFVNHTNNGFNLCKVKLNTIESKNIIYIFLNFIKACLFNFRVVSNFYKLEKISNRSKKLIIKKIILNLHIINEKKIDWLHFGFATQAIGRENIAKAVGAKMAVSLRGFDIDVYPLKHKDCYSFLWKSVDKVHSISNYLLNKANILGLDKNTPAQIITPAIDSLRTNKSISKINNSENLKICTIGRLHWIKNYTDILKSLKILKDKEIQFKYHIIGEGVLLEALQYEVYEYGLNDSVIFEGKLSHQETIQKLYDSDVYIQYSYSEGFCNAALEAQSKGVLSIVSDGGAFSENVINGETGWVIQKNSPKLLAEKIVEVINLPDSNKEKIRKQAIERVTKEFNIEKQQKEFIDFYTK
jgi:colanic acid/amylovoran biosynthesis glycosyltransferase